MAIKKSKTDKCKLYDASRIISVKLSDGEGKITFLDSNIGTGVTLPISKDEYAHAAVGAGTSIDAFDDGLSKAFRYQFLICTKKDKNGNEVVTAIHTAPLEDYMSCDWSTELSRTIPNGGVLCTFRDNGGIDLNTFPPQFADATSAVLGELAKLDEISSTTAFTIGDINCKVRTVDGQECMLVMKRKKK